MTKARDLANIISGGFTADDIPNLDASKITSGSFADARIPNLATSKITSGTFDDARIAASNVSQHATSFDDNKLVNDLSEIIFDKTGITPDLSTSGGTSDARFIKNYGNVVEFGLISETMHQIDESVDVKDIKDLTDIYYKVLTKYF